MKFRIAKASDANRIAEIQRKIKEVNDLGIFCHMGKSFLSQYYKILIEDPTTVFVCAINDDDIICGYCFNVLDASVQNENMRSHKFQLAFSALSSILVNPSLIKELYKRYKSLKNNDDVYLHNEGAHGGYWGWDPGCPDSLSSFELHERTLLITKLLGVEELRFEVDKENKHVFKFHKLNGAIIEKEFILPDGRERVFMSYDLKTHKYKI